jgi:uncharacterized protein (DUF58 family)
MSLPKIWPGRALGTLLLVPATLSLALFAGDAMAPVVVVFDLAVLAFALLDLSSLRGAAALRVSRHCGPSCSLGEPQQAILSIENPRRKALRMRVRDDIPDSFKAEPAEFQVTILNKSRVELEYRLIPCKRGTYALEQVDALVSSRLGLWARVCSWPVRTEVRVYPDVRQIARYTVLARRDRLSALGVRSSRRLGTDNEFERLRDYTNGDDPRHLDWRATARRRKLTVRAFQHNQSQRIVFLIDCGRMMAGDTGGGLSPLDHAFNAMLLLAHVALLRNDQVGLLAFSQSTRAYVPPGGGPRLVQRLVHAVHNVFPEPVESRYDRAFMELEKRCRKRSLVVVLTNLFDEVSGQILGEYLENLSGRHLPLGVFLRDHDLFALADTAPKDGPGLYKGAAAADLLNWRERVFAGLRRRGVLTLDVFPSDLTGELVNRYLEIKARHLL